MMARYHVALLTWTVAMLGCSGEPMRDGQQPYGAGTSASDEPEMPEGGAAGASGIGGVGGASGASGTGAAGDGISAGVGGLGGVGGGDPVSSCDEMSLPAPVGACVTLAEPMAGEYVSMTGVVEAVEYVSESSCAFRALGFMGRADGGRVYEVVVRDGDKTVRVSVQLPWPVAFAQEGQKVSIEYKAELPQDSVGHGDLTVRDEAGQLLLWVAQAARGFDSVGLPELQVFDHPLGCAAQVPCGSSVHNGIRAFDGATEATIPYAESAQLDALVVTLGDNTKIDVDASCSTTASSHRVVIVAADKRVLTLL